MELSESRALRPRRSTAGNRMSDLLSTGLDEEEEALFNQYDSLYSDSSFSVSSDEETVDEVDSDFSDEEEAGTLEGEVVETEKDLRKAERLEKQKVKRKNQSASATAKKKQQSSASSGMIASTGGARGAVRLRPEPTIPHEQRMQAALQRAEEVRDRLKAAREGILQSIRTMALPGPAGRSRRRRGAAASHNLLGSSADSFREMVEDGWQEVQRCTFDGHLAREPSSSRFLSASKREREEELKKASSMMSWQRAALEEQPGESASAGSGTGSSGASHHPQQQQLYAEVDDGVIAPKSYRASFLYATARPMLGGAGSDPRSSTFPFNVSDGAYHLSQRVTIRSRSVEDETTGRRSVASTVSFSLGLPPALLPPQQ